MYIIYPLWPALLDQHAVQGCKYFRGLLWPLSSGKESKHLRCEEVPVTSHLFVVSIQGEHKVFPYYKHLLQENYVEYGYATVT